MPLTLASPLRKSFNDCTSSASVVPEGASRADASCNPPIANGIARSNPERLPRTGTLPSRMCGFPRSASSADLSCGRSVIASEDRPEPVDYRSPERGPRRTSNPSVRRIAWISRCGILGRCGPRASSVVARSRLFDSFDFSDRSPIGTAQRSDQNQGCGAIGPWYREASHRGPDSSEPS